MQGADVAVEARKHRRELLVGLAAPVHEAVVAVFGEVEADAERRLVDPHEVVVADHERQREERPGHELGCGGALRLGAEALPGAVRARKARVERGEAPLRDEQRAAAPGVALGDGVGEAHGGIAALEHDVAVEVGPRVVVEGEDVADLPGLLPDELLAAHSGEAAAEQ